MKKIFVIFTAALAIFSGCNKQVIEEPGQAGSLSLSLSYEGEYGTKADVSEINLSQWVNIDDFIIDIYRPSDGHHITGYTYKTLKEQGVINLIPANYEITATSPDTEAAAWNQPIFSGKASFAIVTGQVTSVSLMCTLQNMMVTIVPSQAFNDELSAYDVTVSNGSGELLWTKDDVNAGKAGFFTVAPLKIKVDGQRSVDPTVPHAVFEGQITNVAAKDHHVIKLDAVNTGALDGFEITIDYSTNPIYSNFEVPGTSWVPVPGDDENPDENEGGTVTPDEPTIDGLELRWPNNSKVDGVFPTYELKGAYADGEVDLEVYSKYGISSFLVKITSPSTSFVETVVSAMGAYKDGEYAVLDMLDPDVAAKMSGGLGLTAGDDLLGADKTVAFPLKGLLPFMIPFDLDLYSVHTFIMDVTDVNNQQVVETLTFEYRGNNSDTVE